MLIAAALAALLAAALVGLIATEPGTSWLAARLLAATPALTFERVEGSLLRGVRLQGVRFRTARDELTLESLALDWNTAAAFAGTLAFERASVSAATYRRLPPTSDEPPGSVLDLPFPVRLDRVSVDTLSVTIAERTVSFGATSGVARYFGKRLELDELRTSTRGIELAGNATVTLLAEIELAVAADWSSLVGGVATSGTATLNGTWPELAVRDELKTPFTAVTTGTVNFADTMRVALVSEWQALAWPSVTVLTSRSGRLELTGELGAYRYDGAGQLDISGREASFTIGGTGAQLELVLERLELGTPSPGGGVQGTLLAAGVASLAERTADVAVTANDFDPDWLVAGWPGRLAGDFRLQAALTPELEALVQMVELHGVLRGYPVTLSGAAAFTAPADFRLDNLRLDSEDNRVVLAGTLDRERMDLTFDAQLEQVDLLLPGVQGELTAAGTLDGSWAEPHARGTLAARTLAFAGISVESFDANGEIGFAPAAPLALTVTARNVARGPIAVQSIEAAVDGTGAAHTVQIELDADDWDATLAATGRIGEELWQGTLERVEIDERVLGPWRLEAPTALAFGRSRATLETSCLLHVSRARWCTELDLQGRPEDRLVVLGQNFQLATLRPLLPPELTLEGVYQVSGVLFDLMGEPRGALALSGDATRARVAFGDAQAYATEIERVRAGVTLEQGALALTASLASTGGGNAELEARVADVRTSDSPIGGALRVQWPDLRFLTLLSPELEEIGGALGVDLTVAGTVDEPTLDGRAEWSDGRIAVPRWGFTVEGIAATATSADGRTLDFNATGRAGDGTLTLTGATVLDGASGWPTRLALRGDAVRLVQLPQAEIFATPTLNVDVALPNVTVTGSLHVPRATIELDALPAQAVPPSPDAVIHGGAQVARTQPLRLRSTVELTLGDEVSYTGLNLNTKVAGELRLVTEPNRSATATGTLLLTGTYDAYGQTLELERGRLLFSGPLDNPSLDVRAMRTVDTTEVGVELAGSVRAPRTRIFSTPAMSEADALSYLLFGRPASGTADGLGSEETSTLQTAALSLGLQQALPVVQRIGTSLGLDEFSVQSTSTDAGALMAGKYLSPKLYIRYSYGLFNRIGGLLLRFKVNERLSVETRSGDQKSMDLLYTIEKE